MTERKHALSIDRKRYFFIQKEFAQSTKQYISVLNVALRVINSVVVIMVLCLT